MIVLHHIRMYVEVYICTYYPSSRSSVSGVTLSGEETAEYFDISKYFTVNITDDEIVLSPKSDLSGIRDYPVSLLCNVHREVHYQVK